MMSEWLEVSRKPSAEDYTAMSMTTSAPCFYHISLAVVADRTSNSSLAVA
jgi:hypothetical protein